MGRVPANREDAIGLCGLVRIDYDERRFLAAKDSRDLPAHSAIAAEDVVLFERLELCLHPSPPKQALEHLVFHDRLHGHGENIQHQADAAQHDEQVERAARLREGSHLAVSDGGHRHDGHVSGVEEAPAFYDHVAGGADDQHRKEGYASPGDPTGPPGR